MNDPKGPTEMTTKPACGRCGKPAEIVNQGQPFCTPCWDAISDTWSACLRCGQVFETQSGLFDHYAAHDLNPSRGELHYSKTFRFERLPA
jgi:predicted amidophosphoribosyltransferase